MVLSRDGRRAVAWSWDNVLTVWDTESGALLATLRGHSNGITQAAFNPDLSEVVSASHDGTIRVWRVAGGDAVVIKGHEGAVHAVAVSPDGSRIVSGGADRSVRIWDRNGRPIGTLRGHEGGVTAVAWSPDGRTIASGSSDRTLRLWDAGALLAQDVLLGHIMAVAALAFSPDGRRLATGSSDGWVRLWNAQRLQTVKPDPAIVDDHVYNSFDMAAGTGPVITPVATATALRWWSIDAPGRLIAVGGEILSGSLADARRIAPVALSHDGRRAVLGNVNGSAIVYALDGSGPPRILPTAGAVGSLPGSTRAASARIVTAVAMSAEGALVAALSADEAIRTWDLRAGRTMTIPGGNDHVNALTFSPDDTRLAAGVERVVRIWDVRQGTLVRQSEILPAAVSAVAFSPDARLLAAACADGSIRIWNDSGETFATFRIEDAGAARSLAFNASGTRLAAAYEGAGMVALWDTQSFHALLQLPVRWAMKAAFTSDGNRLLVLALNGTVTVFDTRSTYAVDADELVRRLFREEGLSERVIARVKADASLTPALRESAERIARAQGDSAMDAFISAEDLARVPTRTRREYELALAYAEAAVRVMPGHPWPLEARGLALYRLGRLEESAAAFRGAVALRGGYEVIDIVFLRMAAMRLGRGEEAQRLAAEQMGFLLRRMHVPPAPIDAMDTVELSWLAEVDALQGQVAKQNTLRRQKSVG